MSRLNSKIWNTMVPTFRQAVRQGLLDAKYVEDESWRPTHILDIYKMRRGRYKNVRIWTRLNLGTGEREDLFITNSLNEPLDSTFDIFCDAKEFIIPDWEKSVEDA